MPDFTSPKGLVESRRPFRIIRPALQFLWGLFPNSFYACISADCEIIPWGFIQGNVVFHSKGSIIDMILTV